MPNLPFTLRQLEVFTRLSELRSFGETAEKLGISQASVSNQIKELERQLGVQLIERSPGRQPALTREGQAFTTDLQDFWTVVGKLASHRESTPVSRQVTRFRVLIGQGLMDRYIRPKLDDFLYNNPDIECDFVPRLPHGPGALKKLDEGHFDCALLHVVEGTALDERFLHLARVEGGVYGRKKFISGQAEPLSPEAIGNLPFILPPVGSQQERLTLAAFSEAGIQPTQVVGRTKYYDVIASMVERGLGVASLSNVMIRAEARHDIVMLYPLRGWLLVWFEKPSASSPALHALKEFATSAVLGDATYPALRP
ncbi:LysR family transcriptional regulator [Altericroceibacterium xinjiangense]|uniref:LysR family transcriptional regulator n=1 Tax=Altericroceibacterium xinjiangense TaxID=762261 RepID=UPI000F7E7E77|nr:LysR family transcriptional regulator [Altericroceibacterium xinjiangense]